MNSIDWNLIRTFLAVAETGSLTMASNQLALSQPTIGRHINELEAQLGLTLFTRGRVGMILSDAGQELLQDARRVAKGAEEFTLRAAGYDDNPSGTVRISASEVVATWLLPPILTRLRHLEPAIDIELVANNASDNLLARDADIAIRLYRPQQSSLIARRLGDLSFGVYASDAYLKKHPSIPHEATDLLDHTLIGFDRDDSILRGMSALGIPCERKNFGFRTDNQLVYLELIKAGAGIGFCMDAVASKRPELHRLETEFSVPSLPIWLVSHQELRSSLRIRRCMDYLASELASALEHQT